MLHNSKHRRSRGLATVEMALVLPLLVLLVFGVIEFGTIFFVRHQMTLAARESARYLAIKDSTAAQARQVAIDRLASIDANFTVTITEPVGAGSGDPDVSVEISVPQNDVSMGIPGITSNGLIRTRVTMRKESD